MLLEAEEEQPSLEVSWIESTIHRIVSPFILLAFSSLCFLLRSLPFSLSFSDRYGEETSAYPTVTILTTVSFSIISFPCEQAKRRERKDLALYIVLFPSLSLPLFPTMLLLLLLFAVVFDVILMTTAVITSFVLVMLLSVVLPHYFREEKKNVFYPYGKIVRKTLNYCLILEGKYAWKRFLFPFNHLNELAIIDRSS